MPAEKIAILGAREHNLQDVNLELPRDKLIVFCGVSGSGKSSLALDTIYAEGQRRYVESLSVYARQFLDRMEKPKVDHIEGLSPAISIEQKAAGSNPRSTVATITEIHDYLRVLFARVGTPHCVKCDLPISSQTPEQIVDRIMDFPEGTRAQILAPVAQRQRGELKEVLDDARRQGFVRARIDGKTYDLSERLRLDERQRHTLEIVVDRLVIKQKVRSRLADSVATALKQGDGTLICVTPGGQETPFSERFACPECGESVGPLTPAAFSFNSPTGMCPQCEGLGTTQEIDPSLIISDPNASLAEGALEIIGAANNTHTRNLLEGLAAHFGFDVDTAWKDLTPEQQQGILFGTGDEDVELSYETRAGRTVHYRRQFEGLAQQAERRYRGTKQRGQKEFFGRFISDVPCPACDGSRLRPESVAVRIEGKSIVDICRLSVEEGLGLAEGLEFTGSEAIVAEPLIKEVRARLRFMADVGLGYLTLDRAAPTLSGGENQRIRLATQIGAGLSGVLYVLDEPSIGLHARDLSRLLQTLFRLRDLGNTVLVVEHDPQTIRNADWAVEFGPGAGVNGGRVMHSGPVKELLANEDSLTGQYLSGVREVPVPAARRPPRTGHLTIQKAGQHNLKRITVEFPLGLLTCVTGVSGSGKSTLVNEILHKGLSRRLYGSSAKPGDHAGMLGLEHVDKIVRVSQDPIGRTPRSNPATYAGVLTLIRDLFAMTPEAKIRGYSPARFSFNVRGGRCDTCDGDGTKRVEMHFLPDVYVPCEVCGGMRYNRETLQVRYRGKTIAEVLEMTVWEALEHFQNVPRVRRILKTLTDVGLEYIRLGQSATTLSGGEAQRVKLAKELSKVETGRTIYVLDEPTTGLHFADIERLLAVLQRLVDAGNTVIVIEHNLDVIKVADWVIDLGPEGGDEGGRVIATGPPEKVAESQKSHTGRCLREVLPRSKARTA